MCSKVLIGTKLLMTLEALVDDFVASQTIHDLLGIVVLAAILETLYVLRDFVGPMPALGKDIRTL
jgi:hypothetical protein